MQRLVGALQSSEAAEQSPDTAIEALAHLILDVSCTNGSIWSMGLRFVEIMLIETQKRQFYIGGYFLRPLIIETRAATENSRARGRVQDGIKTTGNDRDFSGKPMIMSSAFNNSVDCVAR